MSKDAMNQSMVTALTRQMDKDGFKMTHPRQIQISSLPNKVQTLDTIDSVNHVEKFSITGIEKMQESIAQD